MKIIKYYNFLIMLDLISDWRHKRFELVYEIEVFKEISAHELSVNYSEESTNGGHILHSAKVLIRIKLFDSL